MKEKDWKFKTGLVLVILSIILFLVFPFLPFLDIEKKTKVIISTITLVSAEIMFYAGGFLLGKELFKKYKSFLNPKNWFKKRNSIPEKPTESKKEKILSDFQEKTFIE